jgi:hypothetical protein
MLPAPFACDFCGGSQRLRSYATETTGANWHACEVCVGLIAKEDWNNFIERIIAAFAALQFIPESEQNLFRHELTRAFAQPTRNEIEMPHRFTRFLAGASIPD